MPRNGADRQAIQASRIWDVVIRGGAPETADLDAPLMATISRLHELGSAPRPDQDFVQRLEAELLRAQTRAILESLPNTRVLTRGQNGASVPVPIPRSPSPRALPPIYQWLTPLATAALLLFALAGTLVLMKGPLHLADRVELPVILPAIFDTPEPVPEVTVDTILMQGRFTEIPLDAASEQIERTTLSPGAEWALGKSENDGEGPWLYRVESGELTINADGPITVTRADEGDATTISPGTDVVLRAGDQGLTPSGVISRWRNDGAVPTVVMDAGITTIGYGDMPQGVVHVELVSKMTPVPKVPSDIVVRRVTLPPQTELPVDTIPGIQLLYPESGEVTVIDGPQASGPSNPLATNVAVKKLELPRQAPSLNSFPPGRIIRNSSTAPATLLIMTATDIQGSEATTPTEPNTSAVESTDVAIETRQDTVLMQGTFDTFPKLVTWQGIARATLAPGTEMDLGKSENDGEGPMLYRVEFGELIVNAAGPISITRAGKTAAETIPAGTDVVLQEGDQGFTPSGVASRWRNERKVPTVILDAGFTTSGIGALPDRVTHDAVVSTYASALKSPVAVSVRRLTLPSGEALGPRDLQGVQLMFVESGEINVISTDQLNVSTTIFSNNPNGRPGQTVAAGEAYPGEFPADGGVRVSGPDPATVLVMVVADANATAGSPMS